MSAGSGCSGTLSPPEAPAALAPGSPAGAPDALPCRPACPPGSGCSRTHRPMIKALKRSESHTTETESLNAHSHEGEGRGEKPFIAH